MLAKQTLAAYMYCMLEIISASAKTSLSFSLGSGRGTSIQARKGPVFSIHHVLPKWRTQPTTLPFSISLFNFLLYLLPSFDTPRICTAVRFFIGCIFRIDVCGTIEAIVPRLSSPTHQHTHLVVPYVWCSHCHTTTNHHHQPPPTSSIYALCCCWPKDWQQF